VICQATDGAHQTTTRTFVVRVRDTTGPALQLPGSLQITATTARGARVTYVAGATDSVDSTPQIACGPASASDFALGTTAVTCTGTDASGNQTQGGFTVLVAVAWSNFLTPINPLAVTAFLRGLPVAVKFSLSGSSGGITNLAARLWVAPVDGAGNVGVERPAVAVAPVLDNLFRYVPLAGQYLVSLNTAGMQSGVWQLRVELGDGLSHTARIRLL
jgi:large repetitive protein